MFILKRNISSFNHEELQYVDAYSYWISATLGFESDKKIHWIYFLWSSRDGSFNFIFVDECSYWDRTQMLHYSKKKCESIKILEIILIYTDIYYSYWILLLPMKWGIIEVTNLLLMAEVTTGALVRGATWRSKSKGYRETRASSSQHMKGSTHIRWKNQATISNKFSVRCRFTLVFENNVA